MRRLGLAFVILALAMITGCHKKKPTHGDGGADAGTDSGVSETVEDADPVHEGLPLEYSAPSAPAGDVFLISPTAVIHVDPTGKITREAKTSLLDIATGPGGDPYGLTTADIRRLTKEKGAWKSYAKHGEKTAMALVLANGSLRVTAPATFHILTPTQLWEGPLEENVATEGQGGDHHLSNPQLDGAGNPWGLSPESKLVTRNNESPKWISSKHVVAFAARSSGNGAFALTEDRLYFNGPDDARVWVALPFTATSATAMRVGPTDVCVVRSNDDLVIVTPNGGQTKTKAKLSDVWTVDGRGRIWTLDGADLNVFGVMGHVIATKKLAAALKPAEVTRLVVFGSGAAL